MAMLNDKQIRFVDEYCISHSAAAAARQAGYSTKTARSIGHELLTKPDVQAAIQARQATTALELGVTRQQVLSDLLEAIQVARTKSDPGGMIAGAREIGRMLGFYTPEAQRVELTVNDRGLAAKYKCMSDAELSAIIDGQAA